MSVLLRLLLVAGWLPWAAHAETAPDGSASQWLQRASAAAHQLNYSGTFIYRYGPHLETSRITHLVDGGGEHEKLEALDGAPREVIRNNDQVRCYIPDGKSVIVEKRKLHKSFPALLPKQLSGLAENYQVKLGGQERVGGYDCQVILVEPKDDLRYGHILCAESRTALLLKARMVNPKGETVEQFSFTQLNIGGKIDRKLLQPRFPLDKVIYDSPQQVEALPPGPGWGLRQLPSGFSKVMEVRRMMSGKKFPVKHLVLSDGLAAVSVFIEPIAGGAGPIQGLASQGGINVYARQVADHQVTVLGEVPMATVMQVGNSVAFGEW